MTVELLDDGTLKATYGTIEMPLTHRHYDVFGAKMPDFFRRLAIQLAFHSAVDGSIASVSLPLGFDPLVEDLIFTLVPHRGTTFNFKGLPGFIVMFNKSCHHSARRSLHCSNESVS